MAGGGYAVLLRRPPGPAEETIAAALAEVCGWTLIDARRQVHRGRGIVAERLAAEAAQRLGGRLHELGVAGFAVPQAELVGPLRPATVITGRVWAEGFEIEDQLHRTRLLPWAVWRLVAAATVERPAAPERRRSGGERPLRPGRAGSEEEAARRHLVDLYGEGPAGAHLRLEADRFNYSYLALDGRLALRWEENLRSLLADLVAHAEAAEVTPAARALRRGEVLPEAVVADPALYDAELRWRVQVLRSCGRTIAPGPPGPSGPAAAG